jgi:hypothetical protein
MTNVADKNPRKFLAPVTTMEEITELSPDARAELLASLADAEREIADGGGAPYDSDEMRSHFRKGFRDGKASSK